jgi:hypothetical protein
LMDCGEGWGVRGWRGGEGGGAALLLRAEAAVAGGGRRKTAGAAQHHAGRLAYRPVTDRAKLPGDARNRSTRARA